MRETVRSIVSVTRKNLLLLGLLIGVAAFGGFAYRASATSAGITPAVDASAYDAESLWLRDGDEDILVPESAVGVVATYPIGEATQSDAPTVADVASVYASSSAAFSGQAFAPGGQANTPAITRMMVDDLTLGGSAPYSIGQFHFSMCNFNVAAVSVRLESGSILTTPELREL
ncbi:MAG: hypothetical protein IPG58_08430 [Acidobacteria bacterium]|nr:hypothetical protein [Acidobacteriota bacterium]